MSTSAIGNYRLLEKLGEGGMGAVYKGVDVMVEREVAIKMLRPEIARQPDVVARFRAEAVALAKLNHPNIATLYSFFRQGDEYFMVMEFVHGHTLESVIRELPPISAERAVSIASQVLDAIEHAHSYGILHRDIKPANIMLTASGQVKVTDFGIARVLGTARMTREGLVCGTLQYLAPERIRGQEADLRSDLYSMGCVLYEMLSHHQPFERNSEYELMRAHLEETPPTFASRGSFSVPPYLEEAVGRALAKLPEQRFATATEFRNAITGVQATRPAVTSPVAAAPPSAFVEPATLAVEALPANVSASMTPVPQTTRWKLYAALAGFVLVLIGVSVALYWSRKQPAKEGQQPPPAAVETQPTTPPVQTPVGGELRAAPAQQNAADTQKSAAEDQGQAAGSAATRKTKSPAKSASDAEKRKAALDALNKGEAGGKTKRGTDKKSSALKALNN